MVRRVPGARTILGEGRDVNVNDTAKVSRVEVIDDSGRAYTVWKDGIRVWCDLQDDGRTLKVFIDGAKRDESSACTSTAGPGPQAGKPGAEPGTSATSAGVDRDRVLRAIRALGLIKCETIDDVRALSDVITSLSDACWDTVVPPNRAGLRGQCDCE